MNAQQPDSNPQAAAQKIESVVKNNRCPRCDGLRLYFGKGASISPGYHPCHCSYCMHCYGTGKVRVGSPLEDGAECICPRCEGTGFPKPTPHAPKAAAAPVVTQRHRQAAKEMLPIFSREVVEEGARILARNFPDPAGVDEAWVEKLAERQTEVTKTPCPLCGSPECETRVIHDNGTGAIARADGCREREAAKPDAGTGTPRTDAAASCEYGGKKVMHPHVPANFARQLERELSEKSAEMRTWRDAFHRLEAMFRDKSAEVERLREQLRVANFPTQQATNCGKCGEYKHTPWKDSEWNYVCATCLVAIKDEELRASQDRERGLREALETIQANADQALTDDAMNECGIWIGFEQIRDTAVEALQAPGASEEGRK